jgi:hypothetical protein
MFDTEARDLGILLGVSHAVPLRIDIDTHTMIDDESW